MIHATNYFLGRKYQRKSDYPISVLERFIRIKKITAITYEEWRPLRAGTVDLVFRLCIKYDIYGARRYVFEFLDQMVGRFCGLNFVLLNGSRVMVDDEKYAVLVLLNTVNIKVNDIENGKPLKRKVCKTKSGHRAILENS